MTNAAAEGGGSGRASRLPRWTRQEILVLIEGKRVVESRGGRGRRGAAAADGRPLEPKWAAVAAYCRRHGMDRGAIHCRKRWSNLAGDFKKIKEWEEKKGGGGGGGADSFWGMRSDVRRERRLPGFFDREVYDILDGVEEEKELEVEVEVRGIEGRTAAVSASDTGLFSDSEEEKEVGGGEEEEEEEPEEEEERQIPMAAAAAMLVSEEEKSDPSPSDHPIPGMAKDKHPADVPEKGSASGEGHKRRRTSQEGAGDTGPQSQLVDVLERNSRMLAAHLEAQNVNFQLDRDQRKDHVNSLLGVLSKFADALGRIADKL